MPRYLQPHAPLPTTPCSATRCLPPHARCLQMYMVLLGKGMPVQMHGQPDTGSRLEELLAEFSLRSGTLVQVIAKLKSYVSTNAPNATSVEYDLHLALLQLLKIFAAREPFADLMLPEVKTQPRPQPSLSCRRRRRQVLAPAQSLTPAKTRTCLRSQAAGDNRVL